MCPTQRGAAASVIQLPSPKSRYLQTRGGKQPTPTVKTSETGTKRATPIEIQPTLHNRYKNPGENLFRNRFLQYPLRLLTPKASPPLNPTGIWVPVLGRDSEYSVTGLPSRARRSSFWAAAGVGLRKARFRMPVPA